MRTILLVILFMLSAVATYAQMNDEKDLMGEWVVKAVEVPTGVEQQDAVAVIIEMFSEAQFFF